MNFSSRDWEIILKAVANRRRIEILKFLKQGKEATVGDIAEHINLSFKSTSRHLAVLFAAEILDKDQRSLEVYYMISSTPNQKYEYITRLLKVIL